MLSPQQEEAMTEFLRRHFVFTQALPGDEELEDYDYSRMIQDYRLGNELGELLTAMGWGEPKEVTAYYGALYDLLRRVLSHVQLAARRGKFYFYVQGQDVHGNPIPTDRLKETREARAVAFARERKLRVLLAE